MAKPERLNLNLASEPLRNRRFFYLLLSVIIVSLLVVSFFAGKIFLKYKSRAELAQASLGEIERLINIAQREEKEFKAKSGEASEKYGEKVRLVNGIIFRKSFSWIEFLSKLEDSLPDQSYIVSLAPTLTENSRIELRFKVVSQNLNDLLQFINHLNALKFRQIRFLSESKNESGQILSEISLSYERDI